MALPSEGSQPWGRQSVAPWMGPTQVCGWVASWARGQRQEEQGPRARGLALQSRATSGRKDPSTRDRHHTVGWCEMSSLYDISSELGSFLRMRSGLNRAASFHGAKSETS